MLADPEALDRFLEAIFSDGSLSISVKTRIGFQDPEKLPALMEVFNRYPIRELTVHPRLRKDFYTGPIDQEAFRYISACSTNPLCYNGNLCSTGDIRRLAAEYPGLEAVMLGRGLIGDPGMLTDGGTQIPRLEAFYNALLEEYTEAFGGSRNAMFRLKENWRHLLCRFEGSEKLGKRLRKTTDIREYRAIVQEILRTLPLAPQLNPDW
jgi:tRNA-dihydrouridine synthase